MTAVRTGKVHTKKRSAIPVILGMIIGLIVMTTLVVQLFALNRKYQSYKAREAQLTEELQAQKEKKQDLKDYEKYTKTKEYTESQARSKLGLLYDNEIIFKEK
ncbi:MAG TPA: cell-division initiation protein [Lachnospiraceae bacterium]|jgi:cell division protein DivIC|nr:septum formation initiator family protein [Lachnospiraceae bacterium]MDD7665745.1 septum formation initiator family protein [Lachnospiraceae bacterium]MDY4165750.1 septum formation initiator family protein [Lachnospiraceae bacterium]HAP02504.1 cell-division initiation protein [Lachnospiraceae bacterium]